MIKVFIILQSEVRANLLVSRSGKQTQCFSQFKLYIFCLDKHFSGFYKENCRKSQEFYTKSKIHTNVVFMFAGYSWFVYVSNSFGNKLELLVATAKQPDNISVRGLKLMNIVFVFITQAEQSGILLFEITDTQ